MHVSARYHTFSRHDDVVDVDFGIDPDKPLLPMRVIG
jgi:hypothetical protein